MLHVWTCYNCYWFEQRRRLFHLHEDRTKVESFSIQLLFVCFSESSFLGASIDRLAVQHPLDDSDNALFLWAQVSYRGNFQLILMSTMPNDSRNLNELLFIPRFSYMPPSCVEFLQMRSVVLNRQQAIILGSSDEANDDDSTRGSNSSFAIRENARYNQLMVFIYTEQIGNGFALKVRVYRNFW